MLPMMRFRVARAQSCAELADLGVTGIVLSKHGGRQLDRAPVPFQLLPQVAREVGKDLDITSHVTQLTRLHPLPASPIDWRSA
jgi:isopentenyl diphosphate isomerase/L-lactate dehydrogenase-like FMN-dependent dehydrogenase